MRQYTSQFQGQFEFMETFDLKLDETNRWVQLAKILPWDKMVEVYQKKFNKTLGAPGVTVRVLIGCLVIKHKLNLPDEEVLPLIQENPYMQYFLGLSNFQASALFSPSYFVEIRKEFGYDILDEFTVELMRVAFPGAGKTKKDESETLENKGQLKIDATVAPQYIKYPTDWDLLNQARLITQGIIDDLYDPLRAELKVKPRTYRRMADKRYLALSKMKKKPKSKIRMCIRYLLNCVKRNLEYIEQMLDLLPSEFPLAYKKLRQLWVINTLYGQQREMYEQKSHQCENRIVSISQPQVRPIVRGKQAKKVEFGAKLGLSLNNGFVRVDHLSWDNFNEAGDLQNQAEVYKTFWGYYPELIQADEIYNTNENRKWCKENKIRLLGKPKGKPVEKTAYQKRKEKKERNQRSIVEGKIGQCKAHGLDPVKAKLADTSQSWIAAALFVTNVLKLASLSGINF